MRLIYLDNNATTKPAPEVIRAMAEAHEELWANPSSVHRFGQRVRQRVELARQDVAALINCRDRELVFTSGGTEANNLALAGVLAGPPRDAHRTDKNHRPTLITTKIEHAAIREPAEALAATGVNVVYVPVDRHGRVDPNNIADAVRENAGGSSVVLVSIQWANNETGVIQPITTICDGCKQAIASIDSPHLYLHVDATQAVGKIPVDVAAARLDLLTLSAHKFHGPKGVGTLYIRNGVRLWPQVRGGPQERERRGGTENTAGIIGMGVAARVAADFINHPHQAGRLSEMRDRFEQSIIKELPDTVVNSAATGTDHADQPLRLWNTSNLGFPGVQAEAILLGLSERGVCASAGAACSSGSVEPSPVLLAMGIPEPVAHGSVRFSISRYTTEHELTEAARIVVDVVRRVGKPMPTGT